MFEVSVKVNSKVCSQQSQQQVGSVRVAEPSPTISDDPAPLLELYICCDIQGQPQEIKDDK